MTSHWFDYVLSPDLLLKELEEGRNIMFSLSYNIRYAMYTNITYIHLKDIFIFLLFVMKFYFVYQIRNNKWRWQVWLDEGIVDQFIEQVNFNANL